VDDARSSYEAWRRVAAGRGRTLTLGEFGQRLSGLAARDVVAYLFGAGLSEEEVSRCAAQKQMVYRELLRPGPAEVRGAGQFVRDLANRGLPLAAVSSARPATIDFLLEELGLKALFPVVVDRTLVARGKPAPDIYLLAASLLGVNPARCVVFEDSLDGVRGAKAAGMKCVGLTTSLPAEALGQAGADLATLDFTELSVGTVLGLVESSIRRSTPCMGLPEGSSPELGRSCTG
jgi:HAD superfamily hydrolase (TIGR01509 family)